MRFIRKRCRRRDEKDGNIDRVKRDPESTRIGIIEGGDQDKTEKRSLEFDRPEKRGLFAEIGVFDKGKEKEWDKEQLGMLPDRFVDRGEGGDDHALT